MDEYSQLIVEIGKNYKAPGTDLTERSFRIPRRYFIKCRNDQFEFLPSFNFDDAFHYIKGLVICDEAGIAGHPGSTTLLNSAMGTLRDRPFKQWAQITDWVVENHQNPYSPFNSQRYRGYWEQARNEYSDPATIAQRADALEREYNISKEQIAKRQELREAIDQLSTKGFPDSPEARQRIIEELESEAGWHE